MNGYDETTVLGTTESVCPICLKRIPAKRVAVGDEVYLEKDCPEHGGFKTVIWRGQPDYLSWGNVAHAASRPKVCLTEASRGCPFDCGLCPEHRQSTCCVLVEVTRRCNLRCPVCFAQSKGQDEDPDCRVIENWLRALMATGGPYNIQLSGGEPTVRDDLPAIVRMARSIGYEFIQVNTNGLRLAAEPNYVRRLKQSGLACVFLQFDGTDDGIYWQIRGAALLAAKKAAILNCAEHDLGVVLVPTLVPGVNVENIGDIIRFAIDMMPAVRGVHFQPISYFGRYPKAPANEDRVTIPEVIRAIERQTGGRMKAADFSPPSAENAYCSFNGNFIMLENGELKSLKNSGQTSCCCQPQGTSAVKKAQAFVARRWSAPQKAGSLLTKESLKKKSADISEVDSLDAFLDRADTYSLAISGMAFQDAWNLDLERLRDCFIHVVSPNSRIIPFCAYNLTNDRGMSLYRVLD